MWVGEIFVAFFLGKPDLSVALNISMRLKEACRIVLRQRLVDDSSGRNRGRNFKN